MLKRWNRKTSRPVTQIEHVFHGIEVVPGEQCCQAARKASQTRFLSNDAPRLPLEDCDRLGDCQCRYKHYSDRRTEVRRDSDAGLPKRTLRDDRRDGVGRRITD
jgi:hypothetical protein